MAVDPHGAIAEIDEDNNTFTKDFYVYPHAPGFPVDLGVGLHATTIGLLGDGMSVVVLDEEASVRAVDPAGTETWASPAALDPLDFGPEITPAVGDVDGDGGNEVIATRRLGLAAFDDDGDVLWTLNTKEPVGYPALGDADGDGITDIVVATYGFFGETSDIIAARRRWAADLVSFPPGGRQADGVPGDRGPEPGRPERSDLRDEPGADRSALDGHVAAHAPLGPDPGIDERDRRPGVGRR